MNNIIFPVEGKTACIYKWAWSTVFLRQGTSSSCHRTDQAKIPVDNVGSFHNLPNKVRAREMMRRGEWPQEGCQYCEKIEAAGGMSDRLMQFENEKNNFEYESERRVPIELYNNPGLNEVVPSILEVYFNNTCNMSCLYCGSHFSSKWDEENKKFGVYDNNNGVSFGWDNKQPDLDYEKMLDGFWQYLHDNNNYLNLRQFQIAGGEPFYQKELDQCLKFFEEHPNPNLTFNFITNLKVTPTKFKNYIDRIGDMVSAGALNRLQISSSLDCWGPQQEYVRWGLDLNEWTENFEYLLDKPFVIQCINSAISGLTIKTMPELIQQYNSWRQHKAGGIRNLTFSFMSVMGPLWMDPAIFGAGVFDDDFQKIASLFESKTERDNYDREHMLGIGRQISATPRDHNMIIGLIDYLNEIDRRRGTNWKLLFPWLDQDWK